MVSKFWYSIFLKKTHQISFKLTKEALPGVLRNMDVQYLCWETGSICENTLGKGEWIFQECYLERTWEQAKTEGNMGISTLPRLHHELSAFESHNKWQIGLIVMIYSILVKIQKTFPHSFPTVCLFVLSFLLGQFKQSPKE